MRTRLLLPVCAGAALLLPMCQPASPLAPAGSVMAVDPEADALLGQARQFRAQGKLSKAANTLSRIIASHPCAPCAAQARFELAGIYYQQGQYRDAFKEYGKIIEQHHDSPLYTEAVNRQLAMATDAAEGRLKVKVFFGAWESEMETAVVKRWFRFIIDHAPYNDMTAKAMFLYGSYLLRLEEQEDACTIFAALSERYPDSPYAPAAQLKVAEIWASSCTRGNNNSLVNLNKALEAYEEFTLRFPDHPDVGKARAGAAEVKRRLVAQQLEVGRFYLERSGDYSSAVFCFEDVIRQADVNPAAAEEARRLLPVARSKMSSPH